MDRLNRLIGTCDTRLCEVVGILAGSGGAGLDALVC